MNKADRQNTADRVSAIVANFLHTQGKTQDLARQTYQSRTQFHRLFQTVVEETPAETRICATPDRRTTGSRPS
jgi:AraC family transcriptional regulator